jgi:hypothetical protein
MCATMPLFRLCLPLPHMYCPLPEYLASPLLWDLFSLFSDGRSTVTWPPNEALEYTKDY